MKNVQISRLFIRKRYLNTNFRYARQKIIIASLVFYAKFKVKRYFMTNHIYIYIYISCW